MKASEVALLDFMKKASQFVIPIYQRAYSWRESECRQLWEDIVRTGRDDGITAHFVGSIVYVARDIYHVADPPSLLVIDGQQRLTTLTLLIEALARVLDKSGPVDGFSAGRLRNYYLLNPDEEGGLRYKLALTQTDRTTLMALVDQAPRPKDFARSQPPRRDLSVRRKSRLRHLTPGCRNASQRRVCRRLPLQCGVLIAKRIRGNWIDGRRGLSGLGISRGATPVSRLLMIEYNAGCRACQRIDAPMSLKVKRSISWLVDVDVRDREIPRLARDDTLSTIMLSEAKHLLVG